MEYLNAFLCGGILCAIGQLLIDKTKLTPAKILVCYVVGGVILGGLGIYEYIKTWGGEGGTDPITGIGLYMAMGCREAFDKDGRVGIFTGGFTAAAGGVTAAIVFGYLCAMIFRPRDKS